jgi:hypothetical protein
MGDTPAGGRGLSEGEKQPDAPWGPFLSAEINSTFQRSQHHRFSCIFDNTASGRRQQMAYGFERNLLPPLKKHGSGELPHNAGNLRQELPRKKPQRTNRLGEIVTSLCVQVHAPTRGNKRGCPSCQESGNDTCEYVA